MKRSFAKKLFTAFLMLGMILTAMMLVSGVSAAEGTMYVYVNSQTGKDTNTGLTPSNPLKTFSKAQNCAKMSGVESLTIVFTSEYKISSSTTENTHSIPYIITTHDGTTDYGAQGAKLVFGSALRYVLRGNTTFENITIQYSGTLNFVCNYNPITFGEGVDLVQAATGNGVYVVGGWQSPSDTVDKTLDSNITIKSGTFFAVIGSSRQNGTGSGTTNVYTGTTHIRVSGGKIASLYGGTNAANIATNTVIEVSGGEITSLYVGGDLNRYIQGDAELTLSGGKIQTLEVNNVVGAARVTLCGTEIGKIAVSYANNSIKNLATAAKKTKALFYDAHYYTAAQISEYGTSFDSVVSETNVYAKAGANGSGSSPEDPASFAAALANAGNHDGTVVVIGKISLSNFTEPTHATKATVTGYDASSALVLSGSYTLGGETEFSGIAITCGGVTFKAQNGRIILAADAKPSASFDVVGSASLYTGNCGKITEAGNVLVDGADVGTITGGTTAANIEVHSGSVTAITTAASSIDEFTLTQSGGQIGTLTFSNVKKSLTYGLFGGTVNAYKVSGTNVKGTLKLDENLFNINMLGEARTLFVQSDEVVFFVADGGTGNGSTASAASGSLKDAYTAVSEKGGTIVICGEYTLSSALTGVSNSKKVVVTSVYGGVDYAKTNGAELVFSANYYIGGETEFRDITLTAAKSSCLISASGKKLTIGDNVTCGLSGTNTYYLYIVGGAAQKMTNVTADVTIQSGKWQRVSGSPMVSGSTDYNIHLTITGGEFVDAVAFCGNTSFKGDAQVTISGGTFYGGLYAFANYSSAPSYTGNIQLDISGGTFYNTIGVSSGMNGSYNGKFDVTIRGGEFAHLTGLVGAESLNGSMTSTITAQGVDLTAEEVGTYDFTNPIRPNGADPWLFYCDGYYYYTATTGSSLKFYRAANIGDLKYAIGTTVYTPASGKPWSKNIWSPEIHYYTDAEIGAGNGGWYCYIACDDGDNVNHRMYVIKCLDGDNLLGRWGNPITGEVNVPQKISAPDIENFDSTWAAGQTDIRIGGQLYMMYVTETGRGTSDFYQTINLVKMTNPWTIVGQSSVICRPEYDWEKGGASKSHPQVVEGGTAVYGEDGSIYIIYSGSGYWTIEYKLGQLKYLGGDPLDIHNWEKLPTPILSYSDELNGCGHASYVTDTAGQGWICYHARYGKETQTSRYAFVEPYTADANGVVIGSGTLHPESTAKVYTAALNPLPLSEKISGFAKVVNDTAVTVVRMTLGQTTYTVGGVQKTMDVAPIIRQSRTMLPVRYVAEALGAKVDWDGKTSTATITGDSVEIRITVGSSSATVNGTAVSLDSPAFIESSRTYMPVRFVAEALGAKVDWDGATSTATLTK